MRQLRLSARRTSERTTRATFAIGHLASSQVHVTRKVFSYWSEVSNEGWAVSFDYLTKLENNLLTEAPIPRQSWGCPHPSHGIRDCRHPLHGILVYPPLSRGIRIRTRNFRTGVPSTAAEKSRARRWVVQRSPEHCSLLLTRV
jgi:hypothetical protein